MFALSRPVTQPLFQIQLSKSFDDSSLDRHLVSIVSLADLSHQGSSSLEDSTTHLWIVISSALLADIFCNWKLHQARNKRVRPVSTGCIYITCVCHPHFHPVTQPRFQIQLSRSNDSPPDLVSTTCRPLLKLEVAPSTKQTG